MVEQNRPKRSAIYTRDMSQDGDEQINLDGRRRPRELRKLLQEARHKPRPFDVVIVSTMAVLGTPSQARAVVEELSALGIEVEAADWHFKE